MLYSSVNKALTLVAFPMKNIACFPPTPNHDISLFRYLMIFPDNGGLESPGGLANKNNIGA